MRPLALLAPALIPSWRFFDTIAASPRVEYALLQAPDAPAEGWREFRPRPQRIPPLGVLARLFWNPLWNESLFLVSCAERLIDRPTVHSEDEIFARIAGDLPKGPDATALPEWLAFRLVFVHREGEAVTREVQFQSQPRRWPALA